MRISDWSSDVCSSDLFSFLYYADRVYQLPLGLIGIAIGIVLLPDLARKLRSGAEDQAMHGLNRGLEFALLLTLPATVAPIVIAGARKSVGWGKSVSVRVDIGGRRIIKKTNKR